MTDGAPTVGGNLPSWPGASSVYSYLYGVLARLGAEAWERERTACRKRGRKARGLSSVPEEMQTIIAALRAGDEETLKAIQLPYKLGEVQS